MVRIWPTTGVGVGITAGIVLVCAGGCAVAVGVAGCGGEMLFCTGISACFTTWVGRTSRSGLLVLNGKKVAYVPEATITKQSSITPRNFLLLCRVCLLRGIPPSLSFGKDRIIS